MRRGQAYVHPTHDWGPEPVAMVGVGVATQRKKKVQREKPWPRELEGMAGGGGDRGFGSGLLSRRLPLIEQEETGKNQESGPWGTCGFPRHSHLHA